MKIESWRAEIDRIDKKLLRLLNRRAALALEAGEWKRSAGLPIRDLSRERHVLARARQANTGPLDEQAVDRIFRRIVCESRRLACALPPLPGHGRLLPTGRGRRVAAESGTRESWRNL